MESGDYHIEVDGAKVGEAGPGGTFGELALLYNNPRAATIRAAPGGGEAGGALWMLDRPTFRRTLAASAHNDLEETTGVLRTVPLLEPLTEAQLAAMAEAVQPVHFSAGELVIEKGTAGSIFYILRSGAVLCTDIGVEGGKKFDDLALGPGDYFGERALLRGEPRAANVRATSEVTCLVLDRQGFTELLGPLKDVINANLSRRVLLSVPMLKAISDEELSAVAEACEVCEAAPGAAVIAEGEAGDAFYIVKEGTMLVTQKGGAEAAREVATLGSGDFFGEMALLKDDVRQATVTASGEGGAVLFKLTRKKFVELLGAMQVRASLPCPPPRPFYYLQYLPDNLA